MSRVYITGIAGFLGAHLADYLITAGHDVVGCDNLSTGDPANTPLRFDVRDVADLQPKDFLGVDVVIHLAAAAYEGVSNFSPSYISHNIYAGSAAVFSAAIAAGVKRIVFASSMARYGEPDNHLIEHRVTSPAQYVTASYRQPAPFREDRATCPVDPYGISKEAAERLLINLCETHGLEWSIAVPHNIFGPRQRYVDPFRNVAAIMANRMLQEQQPIIYGDGRQVRCFSYIDDVVPSLARMGFDPTANGEIINIGPDEGAVTIRALAKEIADIIGCECDPIFLPPRPREVKHAVCSSDKARRLLGFEQKTSLYDGLVNLVEWIKERGPRPFEYHLPIEISNSLIPRTWSERVM